MRHCPATIRMVATILIVALHAILMMAEPAGLGDGNHLISAIASKGPVNGRHPDLAVF